jgi:hypothetical protein
MFVIIKNGRYWNGNQFASEDNFTSEFHKAYISDSLDKVKVAVSNENIKGEIHQITLVKITLHVPE